MKRASEIFFIFCFMTFLVLGFVMTLARPMEIYSFYENRNLAQPPTIDEEGLLSGKYFAELEKSLADHVAARNTLLKIRTWLDIEIFHRPVVNEVVMGDRILLPYLPPEAVDFENLSRKAELLTENLKKLTNLVASYGGKYYYVAVPCQYAYYTEEYPGYLNNRAEYTAFSISALEECLAREKINFIDIGRTFDSLGHNDSFSSVTDNHYSIYGAFIVYQTIMQTIITDTGKSLSVLTEENSTVTQLENPYLGSRNRKLFDLSSISEPLYIITPNEPVPFVRMNYGDIAAATVYSLPVNKTETATYGVYMGGDISNTIIETNRSNLPTILVYGDSFTNAVECILYYSFNEMHSLDLRYYSEMSLSEYIRILKPDIVVCIRDYEALLATEGNGGI